MRTLLIAFWALTSSCTLAAGEAPNRSQNEMIGDLRVIQHHFEVGYAPAQWKNAYLGWDIDEAFRGAESVILASPKLSTRDFQRIVRRCLESAQDYHVSVTFHATGRAVLPFSVLPIDGRFFVNWVDPMQIPDTPRSLQVGDELIEFGGQPIRDVIHALRRNQGRSQGNDATDLALAAYVLTHRAGALGDEVPSGAVLVKFRDANGVTRGRQFHWDHQQEKVGDRVVHRLFDPKKVSTLTKEQLEQYVVRALPDVSLTSVAEKVRSKSRFSQEEPTLGGKYSFIPELGPITWVYERHASSFSDELLGEEEIEWHAYVYRGPSQKKIGYLRIPHYCGTDDNLKELEEILEYFEQETEALVIDQVDNFGGSAAFLYEVASMLSDQPLATPRHRIQITQKEVMASLDALAFIEEIQRMLEEMVSRLDGHLMQRLLFLKDYHQFIVDQWHQGNILTEPSHIAHVDYINPHDRVNYTKPIVMVINEKDFSGGDFLPAILRDSQRALLVGKKTAGAGGIVSQFEFPNRHGIALCSYTTSIADRPGGEKIENLGVSPDVEISITEEDLHQDFRSYAQKINAAVQSLLK